jgi:septal ring factor EnvC (AmiA/AmiB activator)
MKQILLLILITGCLIGHAQTKEELEKRRREIQQEIASLQETQNQISKDRKSSLSELKLLERKLRSRYG